MINDLVSDGERTGRYVYAKTAESVITGSWQRIIKARTRDGIQQVKVLSSGGWTGLVDNGITLK
jgi:hypothetical protein